MKSELDKLRGNTNEKLNNARLDDQCLNKVVNECRRVSDISRDSYSIINDIDREFALKTQLNTRDIEFLFFATALQCAKWIFMPSLDSNFQKTSKEMRLEACDGAKIEENEQINYLKKNMGKELVLSERHFTWEEIIRAPVPYDAMNGSENIIINGLENIKGIGKNLCGNNHHVATWGHDPILGWIIGTMNIISRTITFRDFQTFHVTLNEPLIIKGCGIKSKGQTITLPSDIGNMLNKTYESVQEDDKRLFAAVAKQGMHQNSDKFTKLGLQIPIINAETAQNLLKKGWNSEEAKKMMKLVGKNAGIVSSQAIISVIINKIIQALHLQCFDEKKDDSIELYEVKTRKILSYSNCIASSSNLIYVALSKDYNKIDIGGMLVTIYRLVTDSKFISQIKREFLENRWNEIVIGMDIS